MSIVRRWLTWFSVVALTAGTAHADAVKFGQNDIATLFYIAKSNNKDRVDYGIRLDSSCRPTSDGAVFPYWRELEKNPVTIHTLGTLAAMAYGVSEQRVARKTDSGGDQGVVLKQLDRAIWVTTSKGADGHCTAIVRSKIAGVDYAQLFYIYVKLAGPLSIDYVEVKGKNLVTGEPLSERIKH